MKKKPWWLLLFVLAGGLLVVSSARAMSSENYAIDWYVPLSGAGGASGSENYATQLTLGQSVIGQAESTQYRTGLGFWGGGLLDSIRDWFDLFFPLVVEQADNP